MRLAQHLNLFLNMCNKFNNREVQMLDSIYHMTLKSTLKTPFKHENTKILPNICDVVLAIIK